MKTPLRDRQIRLLEFLTSPEAIFGGTGEASPDDALRGIDLALLRLEARFSHEKRMAKVTSLFPRTFELMGNRRTDFIREFVAVSPPTDIGLLNNGRQFFDFLEGRWSLRPPDPACLRDVATCELLLAELRGESEVQEEEQAHFSVITGIRRRPRVALIRCTHNVRPIFEAGSSSINCEARDTRLAILKLPLASRPQVLELSEAVFDFLAALSTWTDPATFGDSPEIESLVPELLQQGLIEARGEDLHRR